MQRFWAKVEMTDGCWLWTGHTYRNGYGGFALNGRDMKAHRFSYEVFIGKIPEGLEIDHVKAWGCENRHCVNPSHLEAVTHYENIQRGDIGLTTAKILLARTHCRNGHEYTKENTTTEKGSRRCKTCKKGVWTRNNHKRRNRLVP